MSNKSKKDKIIVILLDKNRPEAVMYWKEKDYNTFNNFCNELCKKYFGDTINYPLDLLTSTEIKENEQDYTWKILQNL